MSSVPGVRWCNRKTFDPGIPTTSSDDVRFFNISLQVGGAQLEEIREDITDQSGRPLWRAAADCYLFALYKSANQSLWV
jgi:hypothetical protein